MTSTSAQGQEIGVAWDPEGLVCERSVAAGTDGTFYILAHLTGLLALGTTGAEFRLEIGNASVVVLFTVHFFAPSLVTERALSIRPHSTPANPSFDCPYMYPCEECYCIFCTGAGTAAINYPGYCTVSVEPRSWTGVRALYR
jgi:hypothetical protein